MPHVADPLDLERILVYPEHRSLPSGDATRDGRLRYSDQIAATIPLGWAVIWPIGAPIGIS